MISRLGCCSTRQRPSSSFSFSAATLNRAACDSQGFFSCSSVSAVSIKHSPTIAVDGRRPWRHRQGSDRSRRPGKPYEYMQGTNAAQQNHGVCPSRIIPVNPAIPARDSMVTPDYKSFLQFSRDATLVPVAKTLSADLLTPVGAFLSVAVGQKYAFLLESAEAGERVGRYTFVGAQPHMVLTARGDELTIRREAGEEHSRGNVMDVLRDHLRQYRHAPVPGMPPFTSGGVGYFAYDMVRQFERLPNTAQADVNLPDC